ncbi:hypothetical protein SISSUDRAFT_673788 [Sistotremastrum suecicum HHB10207 ss-3]|uniref:Uncharacterized protein n=1 Tax=Sistotremastrum suecicum HHB10207 ss-3 TaxID=1314776 RepID=A0A166E2R6_9AGAM|nr:hypothetical protein SISSUDRAFT_673788 [Sistotremastrum suecicum HHB10207 ss-3]
MSEPSIAVKEEDKMDADAEGESEVSSSEDSDADASGEDDDDPDAQAEAVARLLGDALWADIAKAYETTPITTSHVPTPAERAVLEGIYSVLSELAGDTDAMEAFWSLSVPGTGKSVLELLTSSMRAGSFGVEGAESLATSIDTLLTGRLFGDRVTGKRKRDEDEEGEVDVDCCRSDSPLCSRATTNVHLLALSPFFSLFRVKPALSSPQIRTPSSLIDR